MPHPAPISEETYRADTCCASCSSLAPPGSALALNAGTQQPAWPCRHHLPWHSTHPGTAPAWRSTYPGTAAWPPWTGVSSPPGSCLCPGRAGWAAPSPQSAGGALGGGHTPCHQGHVARQQRLPQRHTPPTCPRAPPTRASSTVPHPSPRQHTSCWSQHGSSPAPDAKQASFPVVLREGLHTPHQATPAPQHPPSLAASLHRSNLVLLSVSSAAPSAMLPSSPQTSTMAFEAVPCLCSQPLSRLSPLLTTSPTLTSHGCQGPGTKRPPLPASASQPHCMPQPLTALTSLSLKGRCLWPSRGLCP